MKKLISLLLVSVMVVSMFAGLQISSSALELTGKCGDNAYWSFDESTGTLTISGTGDVYNYSQYSYNQSPLSNNSDVKKVIISNGIKSIGNYVFDSCKALTEVYFSDSVDVIGDGAFRFCSVLANITIPDSVTKIGEKAFDGTADSNDNNNWRGGLFYIGDWAISAKETVTNVVIDDETKHIADSIFLARRSLKSVKISDSVKVIPYGAFYNCDELTSVELGNNLEEIGDYAFDGCSKLTSVTIPNTVTRIGDFAFCYCDMLEGISLPASVNIIGYRAFWYCPKLASIEIGNFVTSIGSEAFLGTAFYKNSANWSDGVLYLNNWLIRADESEMSYGRTYDIDIREGIVGVASGAFLECRDLKNLTVPASVRYIGTIICSSCHNLDTISVDDKNVIYDSRDNCNAIIETETNSLVVGCKSTVIPNTVTSIGDSAFSGRAYLESITIPNSVTSIGDYAFSSCSSLTSVNIPESVIRIGENAFRICSDLESIIIPKSVTTIEDATFLSCNSLKNVYYTGSQEQWNSIVIKDNNEKLTSATIICNFIPHEHQYNGVVTKEANCSETGIMTYTCSVCAATKTEEIPVNGNHNFEDGYCTRCGAKDPNAPIPVITGTCTKTVSVREDDKYYASFTPAKKGKITFYSTGSKDTMGYLYNGEMALLKSDDDSGEEYNFKITYDVEAGTKYIIACKLYSGEGSLTFKFEYEPETPPSPPVGHVHDEVLAVLIAGCLKPSEQEGINYELDFDNSPYAASCVTTYAQHYCASCGFYTNEPYLYWYPSEPHDFKLDCAYCLNGCGTRNPSYNPYGDDTHAHSFLSSVSKEPDCSHLGERCFTCECGYSYSVPIEYNSNKHTGFTSRVTIQPTCSQKGHRIYTCECGYIYGEDIDALGHEMTFHAAKNETCTKAGNKAYYECTRCGNYYNDSDGNSLIADKSSVIIPAKEHKFKITQEYCLNGCGTKNPNYSADVNEYVIVLEYGMNLAYPDFEINLDGTLICYSDKCSKGELYNAYNRQLVASSDNSATGAGFYLSYPVKAGEKYYLSCCADLGDATICISYPHKHFYRSAVTIEPTCTKAGVKTFICSCGYSYTEAVAKLAHDFKPVVTPPKANAVGFTQYKCSGCGEFKKDNAGKVVKDKYTAPTGKPAGLQCASRAATSEKFSWSKTSGATGYQLQISTKDGKKWDKTYDAKTATSYTVKNLTAGSAYKVRVRFYIKAPDGKNYYSQWATLTSPTLPAASAISKLTPAKKAFTAQWKKVAVTGYQLQYGTNAKFSGAKTLTVKGKTAQAVKSLKGGARYYVRIRTYKTIGGKNYYSTWSGAKSVITKK